MKIENLRVSAGKVLLLSIEKVCKAKDGLRVQLQSEFYSAKPRS